jgi:glucose/arabinose dehydrogenase
VIQVVRNGRVSLQPFADLRDRVGPSGGERGLLGMDVEPGFESSGIFYVNYTDDNGDTNISRFHTQANDPEKVDISSEQVLIHQEQPYPNHNGGGVVFGPDGYLWLSLGDGGSAGDPRGNAQNVNTLLGKLLRIDVVGQESYTIPPDNPFASGGGRQEVYAWGLRNSWRFSFDRQKGDLYIADVGQNQWEEIDYYPAGNPPGPNFGWNYFEGSHPYKGEPPADVELIPPVWQYDHALGCSITGGFVYRGEKIPDLRGVYLYTDYCSGNLYGLVRSEGGEWQSERLIEVDGNFSALGQDANGEIYLLDHGAGLLYRLDGAAQ